MYFNTCVHLHCIISLSSISLQVFAAVSPISMWFIIKPINYPNKTKNIKAIFFSICCFTAAYNHHYFSTFFSPPLLTVPPPFFQWYFQLNRNHLGFLIFWLLPYLCITIDNISKTPEAQFLWFVNTLCECSLCKWCVKVVKGLQAWKQ